MNETTLVPLRRGQYSDDDRGPSWTRTIIMVAAALILTSFAIIGLMNPAPPRPTLTHEKVKPVTTYDNWTVEHWLAKAAECGGAVVIYPGGNYGFDVNCR